MSDNHLIAAALQRSLPMTASCRRSKRVIGQEFAPTAACCKDAACDTRRNSPGRQRTVDHAMRQSALVMWHAAHVCRGVTRSMLSPSVWWQVEHETRP